MVDHREVVLQAVKTRYADEKFDNISAIKVDFYFEYNYAVVIIILHKGSCL